MPVMKRSYRKHRRPDFGKLGVIAFTLFVAFVAYTILTPPSEEVAIAVSPDGLRSAKLQKVYYTAQPSYKIYYRDTGKRLWLRVLHMPSYTNVPHATAVETLEWTPDSDRLLFSINGTNVWHRVFE
jgi:hypothetical protein